MGKIYRNMRAFKRPEGTYINRSEKSVYIKRQGKRICIGAMETDETMYANDRFQAFFPERWAELTGVPAQAPFKKVGLYVATLMSGHRTGVYDALIDSLGPIYANVVMDYAMYCIAAHGSDAGEFEATMADRLLFSKRLYSESWYAHLFGEKIEAAQVSAFKQTWLQQCAERGVTRVWLSVFGTTPQDVDQNFTLGQSHATQTPSTNANVGQIWALDADTGLPITWVINRGSTIDSTALNALIHFLGSAQIQVAGVILDQNFSSPEAIDLLERNSLEHILTLNSSTPGFQTLFDKYSTILPWNVDYMFYESELFGVMDQAKLFATSTRMHHVGLYYDDGTRHRFITRLRQQLMPEVQRLKKAIANGEPAEVAEDYKQYLTITDKKDVTHTWTDLFKKAGFSAKAASFEISAEDLHNLCSRLDVSALQAMLQKAALGDPLEADLEGKLMGCFVASIVRHTIQSLATELSEDTNQLIDSLDQVRFNLMPNLGYVFVNNLDVTLERFFTALEVSDKHFDRLAEEFINRQNTGLGSDQRSLPSVEPKMRGRPRKVVEVAEATPPAEPKKRGRPKGSKNKKTLEREALLAKMPALPKRSPGRPKGSKNKKTLEREARLARAALPKKIGRPKGSKNKATLAREAALEALKRKQS